MSFSRDDAGVQGEAGDVTDVRFSTARKGFDQDQVRAHLRAVAREVLELRARSERLERERDDARAASTDAEVRLDDEALTRLLGEETARVLTTARESAAEIRQKAEESAARLLAEASDEATRLREEAELEASRRRADAANDAEAELSMAKQQGREMVNEARAYRERVLSELARRRELAREQIEQLVHGRDRLVAAFERARLAAVDVMAEMQPIGEPDEYVDLQPTTGPVPVMVVRSDLDARPTEIADAADAPEARSAPFDRETTDVVGDSGDEMDDTGDEAADARDSDSEPVASDDEPVASVDAPVEPVDTDTAIDRDDAHDSDSEPASADDGDAGDADDAQEAELATDAEVVEIDVETDPAEHDDPEAIHLTAVDQPADDEPADDDVDPPAGAEASDPELGDDVSTTDGDVVVDLFARLRASRDADDPVVDERADHGESADDEVRSAGAVSEATTLGSLTEPSASGDLDDATAPPAGPLDAVEVGASDDDTIEFRGAAAFAAPSPFELRDAEVTPLITSAARRLKRVLADEQNGVLEALRRSDSVTSIDDLVPWVGEHAGTYSDAIADELLAAARAGVEATASDGDRTLTAAEGREAIQHASDVVETWLVAPLRERLATAIADGVGDNQAITKKVRAVYREFKTTHIDEHLDDVVHTAHGWGSLAGFRDAGAETRWTIDPRIGACHPDCEDNALAGALPAGTAFPTGALVPPGHPGCVCLLVQAD